jgi:tRNA pseudouridine synthase B
MNGVLVVNKEKDYTSRDIVNIISKALKTKKVGHTGTLDPLATGILVVTVGEATKISELLTSSFKEYIADIELGIETDTLDITGNILKEETVFKTKEEIENILSSMIGSYDQEVPIYSAVKINGKKLYEYAREKEEVELPKRKVEVKEIELLNYRQKENKVFFKMRCLVSKGTYIRSLVRDIATKLNTIGVMTDLIRTKQGKFNIEDAYTLEQIKQGKSHLIKIEDALDIDIVEVDDYLKEKIQNGSILENRYPKDTVLFKQNTALAIYKKYEKDPTKVKPWKMFH